MSRTASAVAAIIILIGMLASPAMANVVAPNAGDTDIDADTEIGDANVGTTVDSGNTNTDASVDNSIKDSGNVSTDARVGNNNTTASYNNTEANPTVITEANPTTITGDVASGNQVGSGNQVVAPVGNGNTVNAPVAPTVVANDLVDVGVNCSVIANCEDNDTINDNDSCNVSSCNQDNSRVHVEDNSTNIDRSFNGNRDSFNAAAFAFGLDSLVVVGDSKGERASSKRVTRDTVYLSGEGQYRSKGKELPLTGMSDDLLRRYIITALIGFGSIGAGLTLTSIAKNRKEFTPLAI